MPRTIWTGAISFGLVHVPVRMYSAVKEHTLHFHFLHEKDDGRIGYKKICKEENKPVPAGEIVRAFEYEKGSYVYMTEEDFKAAEPEHLKTIDIRDFVQYDEIDPIYFRHTYFLGPQAGAERVYALLAQAMEESGLVAIAKFVMRNRQDLGCLRVRNGCITLSQMYFADEVKPIEDVVSGNVKVGRKELEMARNLIDRFTGPLDLEKYKDTYRDTLCDIIKRKQQGKEIHVAKAEEPAEPADLFAALKASLSMAENDRDDERGAKARKRAPAKARPRPANTNARKRAPAKKATRKAA